MEIRSVGVLGAGQMGLGIAQAAARAGFETIMTKATAGGLDAQRGKLEKQLQKDVERGRLTAADHGALLERLRWSTHLHDLNETDLVIESIVQHLTTNPPPLCIAEPASAVQRQARFVGLHFFNPVHAMKLVEVAPSLKTSDETVAAAVAYAKALGKAPVVVADSGRFLVNRPLLA